MVERSDSVKDDGDQIRFTTLRSITATVALEIQEGNFGAVSTSLDSHKGFWMIEFTSSHYPDPDTGELMCKGIYWYEAGIGSQPWFYKRDDIVEEEISVSRVVMANVEVDKISPHNVPGKRVRDTIEKRLAVKVTAESKAFILDEIVRREYIEYDPNRVYAIDENPDEEENNYADEEEENLLVAVESDEENENTFE